MEDDLFQREEEDVVEVLEFIMAQEYEEAMARIKNAKSPGEGGISVEFIRKGIESL